MKVYILLIAVLLFSQCNKPKNNENITIIKGAYIIDADWDEGNAKDIENGYIIIKDDKIIEVGSLADNNNLPENAKVIDAAGKFVVPGLIDGFAVINNQAYANAFLLSGVTSVIGVEPGRRGKLFRDANPGPEIFELGEVGDTVQSQEEIAADYKQSAENGMRVMLLMYKLTPDLLAYSLDLAKKYNMATIGELGFTTYKQAMDMGVNAFVHTTRYSLDIAPRDMAKAVAEQPFSNKMNSPKWKYYQFLYSLNVEDSAVIQHAKNIGQSNSYLLPTLSLLYLDFPEHKNPWDNPVSKLLNAADINNPANKETGNHDYEPEIQENYTKMALKEIELEKVYYRYGAKYLAVSGCDVWGTMPGISLHSELEMLQKVGLSNRRLIAAASSNFHDAFGWKKGKIAKDFDADILILNTNPLENIENLKDIDKLILKGKELNLDKLYKN